MKRTVDLTEKHDFSGISTFSIPQLIALPHPDKPWEAAERSKNIPNFECDKLIQTGNGSDRRRAELCLMDLRAMEGHKIHICFRCGKTMLPWHRAGDLCPECDTDLDKDYFHNWRFPKKRLDQETEDRVTLELNYETNHHE